jgi:L-ascorbate metabolism protein UlaG (beta-lactamase superfamily)
MTNTPLRGRLGPGKLAGRSLRARNLGLSLAAGGCLSWLAAQESLQFTGVQSLTNRELRLTLTAPAGVSYRIEATTNAFDWQGLVTFPTNLVTTQQHTDSATPFLPMRYYRAASGTGASVLSGDHLPTALGDVILHPLFHASLVLQWNGVTVYCDPDDDAAYRSRYSGLPKADLILLTHEHGDHLSTSQIDLVRTPEARIVGPAATVSSLTAAQRALAVTLTNGASTSLEGVTIDAIPASNTNHPAGRGNGYVLTLGGRRIYVSGDTGNLPAIRALTNIDAAFLCMNQPYTLTVSDATNVVRAMRPAVVYPYHYRDQSGSTANAAAFKASLGTDLGIEVRLRPWY